MFASALDPRFKHLHFVDNDVKKVIYQELKSKVAEWTMARRAENNLSDAGRTSTSASTNETPSTSSDSSRSTEAPTTEKVYAMFSRLTKAPTSGRNNNANNTSDNVSTSSSTNNYDTVKAEVAHQFSCFLDEAIVDNLHEDPLDWWQGKVHRYPTLEIGVRKLFCIPATSAPVERVFSSAGNIVDTKRSSLLPQNVDMLVFMYTNKHLL